MSLVKREHRGWPLEPMWTDERIDTMFREMFRDFFTGGSLMGRFLDEQPGFLRLEEYVEEDMCVIRAEMPGIDPEKDVEITVHDGILHVEAHREERMEEERPSGFKSEFHYGRFERNIRLPEGATEADVKASYKNGILEVRVPIGKEAKAAVKVPIEHA
jgi:HSP20 family protein